MRIAIALSVLCATRVASAAVYEIHAGENLFARLTTLQAGDEVIVHAGTYTTPGFFEVTWAGTAAQPIVVRAADGVRPVIQGTPAQNVINIIGSYFTFKGFEIRSGSHGIRLKSVDHAELTDLVLHELGDVGISCNFAPDNCDALAIHHNEIYDTGLTAAGEGMYLGCNDDACRITNSTITYNYIHDLGGNQGDGIEIKTGSFGNTVADNVIVRAKYPGIMMYGYAGTGPVNIVERNLVWHTTVDNGIQVVGQVIVRNNIVIDAAISGIHSKPSQLMTPHDVTITHNTVVSATTACLKTNNWAGEANQLIGNNALYCAGGTAMDITDGAPTAVIIGNIGLGTSNASSGFTVGTSVASDFGDPTIGNVYPPTGSALIDTGSTTIVGANDFNATPRTDGKPDIGAYERTTAWNPGWLVTEGFKQPTPFVVDGAPDVAGDVTITPANAGCCSSTGSASDGLLIFGIAGLLLRRRRRARRRQS